MNIQMTLFLYFHIIFYAIEGFKQGNQQSRMYFKMYKKEHKIPSIKMISNWRDGKDITLIWLLHILCMYWMTIMYPTKMYKYYVSFKKEELRKGHKEVHYWIQNWWPCHPPPQVQTEIGLRKECFYFRKSQTPTFRKSP